MNLKKNWKLYNMKITRELICQGDPHFKLKNKELDKDSENQIGENDGYEVDPKILNDSQKVVGLVQYVLSFRPDIALLCKCNEYSCRSEND